MPKETAASTGDLIDLFDEGGLVCGVVTGEEKGRLKVVTEDGKELRVTVSRVAHRAGRADASRGAAAAGDHAAAVRDRLPEIDLAALWDVLVEQPRRYELGDLAGLALGDDTPVTRSAMLRPLQSDRTYFSRKGEAFEPRSREHVEETIKREAAERARADRRAEFIGRARAALADPGDRIDEAFARAHREAIADLVEVALVGDEAGSRRSAVTLLDDAGATGSSSRERAFNLLHALRVFRRDENLYVHRFRLRTAFPPDVEAAAAADAARSPDPAERRDLRDLCAFTIDDERTTEMDDAVSVEASGGAIRLGIHIADPAFFVPMGGLVDAEALARAATHYFPDVRLPMMPAAVSENAASLVAGADRPALSFLVTISPLGEVIDSTIVASVIRSRARVTYDQADALLSGDESGSAGRDTPAIASALGRLRTICEALEAERAAAGAVIIRAAEVNIRVGPDGVVTIRRIDDRGPARRMIAELMILANRLAAEFLSGRGIPAIYRRQAAPLEAATARPGAAVASPPPDPVAGLYDPVAVRSLRRRMRRGEVGLQPAPHHGLGLTAYTQATSPIRRYQDLVAHRQIKAVLAGKAPPYDEEALARIAATTEEAERAAREAERGTDEYWILRHYENRRGEMIEGVIVGADPRRTEVELTDTLYGVNLAASPDHVIGRTLRLVIEDAVPRAGRLVLREAAS